MSEELIQCILETGALRFGDFTLASGDESPYYLDLRLVPSFPKAFRTFTDSLRQKIADLETDFDALVGIETAGIPFASVVGYEMGLPTMIARKKTKEYGRKKQIEGRVRHNDFVLVIDDVVSTGASKVPVIKAVREAGLICNDLLVLVDRSVGLNELWSDMGVNVHSLLTGREILEYAINHSLLPANQEETVRELLNDDRI